jgi:prepilin-type N-terminal cleavage/methylation domain-containing protein
MRRAAERGITLLELMVVMAILGLLVWAISGGLAPNQSRLRSDAGKVAGMLRFAFDRAMATGSHHRVIINLDEDAYRVERCEGKILLRRGENAEKLAEAEAAEKERSATAQALGNSDNDQAMAMVSEAAKQALGGGAGQAGASCGPVKGPLGRARQLSRRGGITISKVYVAHLEEPVESGEVTINYFPLGYAERALVELRDNDGDVYTVVLHSVSGRVEVKAGELKKPEEYVTEDAEGKELDE